MSKDVQMFVICDHIVNGESHVNGGCPRCYDMGYYFDIYFDAKGEAVLASNAVKLLQEILKIIIEEQGSNVFHPNWGCDVKKRVGTKRRNSAIDNFKIELSIKNTLNYLIKLQKNNQYLYGNMTDDEILKSVQNINITVDSPTGFSVSVEVMSSAGEFITYEVKM